MLPRVKFRNPSIPIEIHRHRDADGPAQMLIYTSAQPEPVTSTTPTTTPPSSTPNARFPGVPDTSAPTHTIDIKAVHESTILQELIEKTGAEVLKPTEQEEEELRELAEFKVRSEADRVEVREKLMKQRREEELLRLARGEITAT
jgi:large subunit ribosomal protein MRP49